MRRPRCRKKGCERRKGSVVGMLSSLCLIVTGNAAALEPHVFKVEKGISGLTFSFFPGVSRGDFDLELGQPPPSETPLFLSKNFPSLLMSSKAMLAAHTMKFLPARSLQHGNAGWSLGASSYPQALLLCLELPKPGTRTTTKQC